MTAAPAPDFDSGQRWCVRGRHAGERPTILVHAVDPDPAGDPARDVIHVAVSNVVLHNPRWPCTVTRLDHVPLTRRALLGSQPVAQDAPVRDTHWSAPRARWRAAICAGQATAIDQPVASVLTELQRRWWALHPAPTTDPLAWLSGQT